MRKLRNLAIITIVLILAGCASTGKLTPSGADADFISNWYKVLYSEAGVVDATMTSLGALYKAGELPDTVKQQAVIAHTQFSSDYSKAVAALVSYYTSPTDVTKSAANSACIQVQVQAAAITAISILQTKAVK